MGTIAALAINPTLYGNLPFDPLRDLLPVTQAVDSTNILVVHPTVQAKTVKELIALAKSGKQLNGGSSGIGGAGHLALELFNVSAGTKITHVPYKGGGPAMTDLLGGQINLIFATAASAIPHVNSGKIRGLAVTTSRRSKLIDLPTVAEAGVPGFEANNWYGVVVPAKTPRPIIDRLNKEFTAVLNQGDVKDMLFKQGLDVHASTPEAFGAYIKAETVKWAKVIRASGAKPE
jgi:tripartite-type tricarboxylate transporter receptor subunit TctC